MSQDIPENNVDAVSQKMLTNFTEVNKVDVLNTQMIWDGSMTTVEFHQQILHMLYVKKLKESSARVTEEFLHPSNQKKRKFLNDPSNESNDQWLKVETKDALGLSINRFGTMSWNAMFHTILDECHLTSYFDMDTLPKNYLPGRVCGQSLQVDLDHVRYNTMHLTLLELINNKNDNQREYIDFIDAVLFMNPIWDLGLQHKLMEKNNQKIYQGNITNYTQQCICPCSSIFKA